MNAQLSKKKALIQKRYEQLSPLIIEIKPQPEVAMVFEEFDGDIPSRFG
jgi:hypothetical protein